MKEQKRNKWEKVITSADLTHNSRKADYQEAIQRPNLYKTSLSGQCKPSRTSAARQWPRMQTKSKHPVLPTLEGIPSLVLAFNEEEYIKGIAALKYNKAAGIDDVLVEQLKNPGAKAHKWLLTMLSQCLTENKIPKLWRQSRIIAILKSGKDSAIPKGYRPISLLCHSYKLYERMILNRVTPLLEQHLIKEQAGFHHGKSTHRRWLPKRYDYRCSNRRFVCSIRYREP